MKKISCAVNIAVFIVGSFLLVSWIHNPGGNQSAAISQAPERRVLYYVDPMNPAHTSDKPGMAPCGMPMEPVYADRHQVAGHQKMPPGTARITPEKQQLMGVRVAPVSVESYRHRWRTLGTVAPDENLTYRITAGDKGWVWQINKSTTGSLIKKDQLMATVYNYDFLTRQQQYLYALEFEERRKKTLEDRAKQQAARASELPTASHGQDKTGGQHRPSQFMAQLTSYSKVPSTVGGYNPSGSVVFSIRDQLEVARLELFSLGVTDYQIDEITRARRIAPDIEIRSPADGIVISRNVSPQQRFDRGEELFVVADLRQVWILADLYEQEARYIRPGMRALVSLPGHGEVLEATVSGVPPAFDQRSHTLKVQLEVDNPGFMLRPGMFVDVEFLITFDPAITVPVDALIDSGLRKTVFVDRGNGFFEPRQVQTGWRFGHRVEITAGLVPRENIAVAGNFFIDSESRMQLAAGSPAGGLQHHGNHSEHQTRRSADRQDGHQAAQPAGHPQPSEHRPAADRSIDQTRQGNGTGIDPICGMQVTPQDAESAGLVSQVGDDTRHFCSAACKARFDRAQGRQAEMPPAAPSPATHDDRPGHCSQHRHAPQEDIDTRHSSPTTNISPLVPEQHGGHPHD